MQPIVLIEVTGQGLFTYDAYCELRLQMSTGDFHTHTTSFVNCDPSVEYTDLDLSTGEFILINEVF